MYSSIYLYHKDKASKRCRKREYDMNEREIIISTFLRNNVRDDENADVNALIEYYENMSAKELVLAFMNELSCFSTNADTVNYIRTCF